jgi:drug/metabolite transporter (DMT)-like permease
MGQIGIACCGSVMFLEIVRLAGPVFLSQAAYVVTVTGILWGMALFGERHGPTVWAAMAAIFAGVMLVQRRAVSPAPMRSPG